MADNIKMGKVVDGELQAVNGNLVIQCTADYDDGSLLNITQTSETPITFEQVMESIENGLVPVISIACEVTDGDNNETVTITLKFMYYFSMLQYSNEQGLALFTINGEGVHNTLKMESDGTISEYH